jgi:hypothetical protein
VGGIAFQLWLKNCGPWGCGILDMGRFSEMFCKVFFRIEHFIAVAAVIVE